MNRIPRRWLAGVKETTVLATAFLVPCSVLGSTLPGPTGASLGSQPWPDKPLGESTTRWSLYYGLCDASAVVALNAELFAVADDEDNVIRVYHRGQGGRAVHSLDLSSFLRVNPKAPEADIEGAARLGDRIYWISSHGRNAKGREAPSRQRFFATTGTVSNGTVQLRPIGQPYGGLLRDLLREPRLAPFNLATATLRAPKAPHALNIEGLAATPAGHLLIAFRNPKPLGQALLVPLLNPAALIEGSPALFGDPILLDLAGRGIRSITLWQDRYLIIAGSHANGGASRLYAWDGFNQPRWLEGIDFGSANPEAIDVCACPGAQRLFIVSDDGCEKIAGVQCKTLPFTRLKRFRAATLDI
jgi:hypothetical protein